MYCLIVVTFFGNNNGECNTIIKAIIMVIGIEKFGNNGNGNVTGLFEK